MNHHWMMNTSFAYNSQIIQNYGAGLITRTRTTSTKRNGFQYHATSTAGIGHRQRVRQRQVALQAERPRLSSPYKFNVSAFYNTRQGYPFEAAIVLTNPIVLSSTATVTTLPNSGGTPTILLDAIGENRLPTFQNLDLHAERPVSFGSVHFVPSVDLFNVTNNNTVQALRGNHQAANANFIQAIVAPRVIRFGIRVNW